MEDFWYCRNSSEDSVFGVSIYGRKKKRWHDFTIMPLYRLGRKVNSAKMWLMYRFHPRHQYHIIRTGLKPGWYDEDELILHACFAMLERYIEWHGGDEDLQKFSDELMAEPDKNAPPGLQSDQAERQTEAVKLYRWWKVERPADQERRHELVMRLYGNKKRMKSEPIADGKLHKLIFEPFEGDEVELEKEFRALERKIDDDEQAMLHRLIDIRRSLWT